MRTWILNPLHPMKSVLALLAVSLFASACDQNPTEPLAPDLPNAEISDAAHGGSVDGFYFLPPIVPAPTTTGSFNPLVAPRVVICALDALTNACGSDPADKVAEYTLTSGTDGAVLSMSEVDEHYRVNWNTKNYSLDPDVTYRIRVFLTVHPGALELGHADVKIGANKGELKNIDTGEFIPLVDNQTLPIKFRIEQGAGCEGELDCGSGTVGPDGGIVTTANGAAGVSVPAGAVDNPITITIRQLDPAQQPGGLCLPTGIRQDGACYDFDTEPEISSVQNDGSDTFHEDVTVGICPSPNAVREERLTLHKYNPERASEGVVELANTAQSFLDCDQLTGPGYAMAAPSLLGRLAAVARRVLSPVAAVLAPEDLHATDIGLAGLTDSFSRVSWAESIILVASAPTTADPGATVPVAVVATTAHNHDVAPTAATDARIRFDYTDPQGTAAFWYATTDAQGEVTVPWELTQSAGIHTLLISAAGTDPSITGDPLIDAPTSVQTLQLVVCQAGLDCGLGTVDETGGTVTTSDGAAGVSVPAGAVTEPVTIVIRQLDPAAQPGGRCLPTGLRQDGACYDFDTVEEISDVTGGSSEFLEDVKVAICPSPNAVREDRLTLHKYDPERASDGVVELPGAPQSFLDCSNLTGPGYAAPAASTFLGRLAQATGRALRPVASVLAPGELFATDIGLAGLTDSFSRVSLAEPLDIAASGVGATALPGDVLSGTIAATTAHNHNEPPTAATDARLRFDYTDPVGVTSVWYATTDAQGEIPLSWPLTQTLGVHTLVISSRDVDPSLQGAPLIDDPTTPVTLTVEVTAAGASVTGLVQYSGTGLGGVTVELVPGSNALNPPAYTGTTNANGEVVFPSVADGTYQFKAYGPDPDYITWKATPITVTGTSLSHTLDLPKKIVLLTPQWGATVSSRKPELTWTANQEAASYTVQVNVTSSWTLVEQNTGVLVNIDTVNTALTAGENYTWQVDAADGAGRHVGTTENAFNFTVFTEDQVNDAATGTTRSAEGSSLYQSFTPGASSLAAVKLRLRAGGGFPSTGYTSTVHIRSGSPTGQIVATTTESIPGPIATGATLEVTYAFQSPVAVDPGQTYVIEWESPSPMVVSWFTADQDPYAGGTAFGPSGTVISGEDFIFSSYSP